MGTKIEKPIKNYLLDFGLTDKEVTCYLTLLKTGPNTIMNLSRETGIKRSTTHNTVEELIKKGLISQTNYGERRMIVAEDPEKLKFLMEQKKWDIKKLEENMSDIVKTIYDLVPKVKENTQVDVKYYDGKTQIRYVYELILKSEKVFSFVNVDKIRSAFPENFEIFQKGIKNNHKLHMMEILEDRDNKKHPNTSFDSERYKVKYLPKDITIYDTDLIVFDENIALISLENDNPRAVVISSKTLAEGLKSIHQVLWKTLLS